MNKLIYYAKDKAFRIKVYIALMLFVILVSSFFFTPKLEKLLNLRIDETSITENFDELSSSSFEVSYIDVGQGNCTYIRFPDNKVMIIDGGDVDCGQKIESILNADGVTKIDYLVASHSDADHIGGLVYLLNKFDVINIYRPFQFAGYGETKSEFVPSADEDLRDFYYYLSEEEEDAKLSRVTSKIYRDFISAVYNESYEIDGNFSMANVTVFYDGLAINGENYEIEFFSPLLREAVYNLSNFSRTKGLATKDYAGNNSNESSSILLITILDKKFFFTGDASWTSNLNDLSKTQGHAEAEFIESLTLEERQKLKDVDVYLLGHHGSSYSSGEDLLSLLSPKFCVVSVGADNNYGHPSEDALSRALYYLRSDDHLLMTKDLGTIIFGELEGALKVYSENQIEKQNYQISYPLLSSTIYMFVLFVIFSIRSKKRR